MESQGVRPERRAIAVLRALTSVALGAWVILVGPREAIAEPSVEGDEKATIQDPDADSEPLRSAAIVMAEEAAAPGVVVFPPRSGAGLRPMVVMLHGMCDPPERECPYFARTVTEFAWLVCPKARLRCPAGGTLWDWRGKYETVARAVTRVHAQAPEDIDISAPRVLIGFSLGALAAVDIAHRARGEWGSLVLIGAKVYPNPTLLQRAGVRQVLLASGDRDMMRSHMVEQARMLQRRGLRARFLGMGNVGHWFAPDMDAWMAEAIAWLHPRAQGATSP